MFQQLKNIDTAFKFIRTFAIAFLAAAVVICCYVVERCAATVKNAQQKVYVLLNGKLLDAMAVDRADSVSVEVRDHVKMFHYYFYDLQPDDEINRKHLTAALYLADNSARQEYDDLMEKGYFGSVVSGNVTQQVQDYDSIQVDLNQTPFYFRYYGKLKLIRPTSTVTRSLITEGYIRVTGISTNNPHGMLIERWKVLENKDLDPQK